MRIKNAIIAVVVGAVLGSSALFADATRKLYTGELIGQPTLTITNNAYPLTLPSTGPDMLVGKSTPAILTNKTISGTSNTFQLVPAASVTSTPSGNLAADDVAEALNELQSDIDSRATASALSTHTGLSSGVHGVVGTVVGTTDNQILTTKTIAAGSNTISGTASRAAQFSAGNALEASSTVDTSELDYLNGVTGALYFTGGTDVAITDGGTGQSTAILGFNALDPLTTKADLITHDGTNSVRQAVGTDGQVLTADSAQTNGIKWATAAGSPDQQYEISNLGINASVGSNALTITLTTKDGTSNPSVGSPVKVGFRDTSSFVGAYSQRSRTSALSLVISSGSTLGHANGVNENIWVYLVDSDGAGTLKLAASSTLFDDTAPNTTVAEGGAGGADSRTVLYSDAAYSTKFIRLIGKLISVQATAGTWATGIQDTITAPNQLGKKVEVGGANALTGEIGETVSSFASGVSATTATFFDVTSISLTAGDWLIDGLTQSSSGTNGTTQSRVGISTTSGNSGTGLTNGDTMHYTVINAGSSDIGTSISGVRANITSTTTYYLKGFAVFTGTVTVSGRITAVRIR